MQKLKIFKRMYFLFPFDIPFLLYIIWNSLNVNNVCELICKNVWIRCHIHIGIKWVWSFVSSIFDFFFWVMKDWNECWKFFMFLCYIYRCRLFFIYLAYKKYVIFMENKTNPLNRQVGTTKCIYKCILQRLSNSESQAVLVFMPQ